MCYEIKLIGQANHFDCVTHSHNQRLLSFQDIWLSKELLPSLTSLIQIVDRTNLKLPPIANLNYMQKKNDFIEGPSRVTETAHPYQTSDSKQTITVPGATFLSVVFDERRYAQIYLISLT